MKPQIGIAILAMAAMGSAAQAGVKGRCTYEGKPVAIVDAHAAMAPGMFDEGKKLPTIWFTSKPLDHAKLNAAKPDEIDDAVMEQAFENDSAKLEIRFDATGKMVEQLHLYIPPGNNRSVSSNEVGKFTSRGGAGKMAGRWVLTDDDDLKCDLDIDLAMGAKGGGASVGSPKLAKLWGTALPAGGGEPGKAYLAMHRATLAGDVDAMLKLTTKARGAEMRKARSNPEFPAMIEMIKAFEPKEVRIVSGQADATRAELQIAGKEGDGSSMTGVVKLVREDNAWKIEKVDTKATSK